MGCRVREGGEQLGVGVDDGGGLQQVCDRDPPRSLFARLLPLAKSRYGMLLLLLLPLLLRQATATAGRGCVDLYLNVECKACQIGSKTRSVARVRVLSTLRYMQL